MAENLEKESGFKNALVGKLSPLKTSFKNLKIWTFVRIKFQSFVNAFASLGGKMIGAMEKELEQAKMRLPPSSVYKGVDLKTVSSYVAFKALEKKNKVVIEMMLALSVVVHLGTMVYISSIHSELRNRPIALVPSRIEGVTEVTPNKISETALYKAINHYLGLFVNINRSNISEKYRQLEDYMGSSFQTRFHSEMNDFIETVKSEDLTEYLSDTRIQPVYDGNGNVKVTVLAKINGTLKGEQLEPKEEVITLVLKVVLPNDLNNWGLEIQEIVRSSSESYKSLSNLKQRKVEAKQ